MRRATIPLVLLAVAALAGIAAYRLMREHPAAPDPGIPRALADARAARVADLRYAVTLRVPAARRDPIHGHLTAAFSLTETGTPLAFDFTAGADHLASTIVNGHRVDPTVQNGHVVIPAYRLDRTNVVDFEFVAGDGPLNRNDDFMYALFVPARASEVMPCFDQPTLKARWTLTLEIPDAWGAVSNGRQSGWVQRADRTSVIFDETPPLPPYLFTFAAGRFSVESGVRNGRTFRMFHRETDAAKVARNRDAVFDLHAQALAWLESYTGIPYPFGKFDIVAIPSFQFSGMEHPGAIFYNASSVLLDPSATQSQLLNRANTIAHETAHMWFGDLVTMTWFDDVWMKEVFANFLAAKIVNPSFPNVNHDLRFLVQNYPAAYDVDRTAGANAIRQNLSNLDEAGSLYGNIIYNKAPIVMRQLERIVGPDAFRDGAREYLHAHAFGNASWPDLIQVLDPKTPVDLAAWSRAWVDEAGRPSIRTDLETANGVVTRLALVESDPGGRNLHWPQRLVVALATTTGVKTVDVAIEGRETVVAEASGMKTPAWILPVAGGLGYGFFDLDAGTLAFLRTSLHTIADPLTRGAALIAWREAMLEGRVPPADVLNELRTAVARERDELNVQTMLDDIREAFWRYTPADDRPAVAGRLEPVLKAGLERATTSTGKAAWFGAIRSVALTPATVDWLERVWARTAWIPGLPLSETDEADLALDLAVRDVPHSEDVLAAQLARFTNPDRRARFQFIMPAVSPDVAVRERFFQSLHEAANRVHEPWVVDAERYLHHPLRAGTSKILVRPALDLTLDISRTGDIFFPKRWADATLAGYQSVQTAAEVRSFIESLPANYPARLRLVLLSAADPLFRAAKLQQ